MKSWLYSLILLSLVSVPAIGTGYKVLGNITSGCLNVTIKEITEENKTDNLSSAEQVHQSRLDKKERKVVRTEYYDLSGNSISTPAEGYNICRMTMSDNTVLVKKTYLRR